MSRSSMFGTSAFDQTQQRFGTAHGGQGRSQPGGQSSQAVQQHTILHSGGVLPALRSLESAAVRQQQSGAQQELRRRQMDWRTTLQNLTTQQPAALKKAKPGAPASPPAPVFSLIKRQRILSYDYLIRLNGQIVRRLNNAQVERYYIEVSSSQKGSVLVRNYRLMATLPVNEYGLVNFPAANANLGYNRYGDVQASGWRSGVKKGKPFKEFVGEGDHYLKPAVAAALFGVLNEMCQRGLSVSLGDMSASNGSDPGTASFHHGGHGHIGTRSGLDVDFRYIGQQGTSYRGEMADGTGRFSKKFNQILYESAFKYGFDKRNTYQGTSGLLTGVRKMSGHNNHGHLGFSASPANIIDYEPYPDK